MEALSCKAFGCARPFSPPEKEFRRGFSLRKGEWTFLAVCPNCGRVRDYAIRQLVRRCAPRSGI